MERRKFANRLALVLLALVSHLGWAQVKVGDTKDACDGDDLVKFQGKSGNVTVKAGAAVTADLKRPTREIEWFCGGSQEFSSNDEPYDRVHLRRAANGAMTWTFYRLPPDPDSGKPGHATRVGDTNDACDASRKVTFEGLQGIVTVNASETKIADLPRVTTEIRFKCGSSSERAANDVPFDQVRIARAINGAIAWTFFLKTAAPNPGSVCQTVHATGQLVFKDEKGHKQPLPRVMVKLMDEDFGPHDQEMARGFTDKNGFFDLRGKGSDSNCVGAGCKRPDPYVEFILFEAHRVDVKDPIENTARAQTKTKEGTCGDINFGRVTWSEAELDAILYFHAQRAYDKFVELTGQKRVPGSSGVVGVEYPTVFSFGTPYTTWNTIHWPSWGEGKNNLSALDHEFGHRLRHATDGDRAHFNWDATRFVYARDHSAKDVTNEGFAFNEGWAYYNKKLSHPGVSVPNGTWAGPKGDNVEGDVANQLFALSENCGGFPRLWHTMLDAGRNAFHTIDEFRAEFMRRNPKCAVPASDAAVHNQTQTQTQPQEELQRALPELLADLDRRVAAAPRREVTLIAPPNWSVADRASVERLSGSRNSRMAALQAELAQAYRKAIESLAGLPREALMDGRYEKAREAARQGYAAASLAANRKFLGGFRQELADEIRGARPEVASHLAGLALQLRNAQQDLEAAHGGREPGFRLHPALLPASIVRLTAPEGQ